MLFYFWVAATNTFPHATDITDIPLQHAQYNDSQQYNAKLIGWEIYANRHHSMEAKDAYMAKHDESRPQLD